MIDSRRVDELRQEVGEDDLAEVVVLFCEEVAETLERISAPAATIAADDMHFLKGSAMNIGLVEMAGLCQLAESALRGDPTTRPDLPGISHAFHRARRVLYSEIGI